jgi:hypothetical protein
MRIPPIVLPVIPWPLSPAHCSVYRDWWAKNLVDQSQNLHVLVRLKTFEFLLSHTCNNVLIMFTRFQWVMTNYMQHVHRLENLTMCTMWVPFSEIIYFHCGQHGFILSQVHCCDISTTSECAIQYIFLYDLLLFSTIHIQILWSLCICCLMSNCIWNFFLQ